MSTAQHRVAILERRLAYLTGDGASRHPMAQNEVEALRWALPLLREVANREAKRPHLGVACPACSAAIGFVCAHLPRRT